MLHKLVDTFARGRAAFFHRGGLALLLLTLASGAGAQVVYTYDNTATGNIPEDSTCAAFLERTFTVSDSFTVGDIALGVDLTHADRGQLRIQIVAPDNTTFQAVPGATTGGDTDDNYRVMLSSNSEGVLDDNDVDPAANSFFRRLVNVPGINFYSGNSVGTWRARFCDLNTAGALGTLNRTRLILRDTVGTATSACGTNLTYNWGDNGEEAAFTSFSTGGVTLNQTATSGEAPNEEAGATSFRTRTTTTGNHVGFYTLRMNTADTFDTELTAENVTFQFSEDATWLSFTLLDVDWTNAAWEDYIRVDGLDDAGLTVPKYMTFGNGQLQFAGDWTETDAAAASNQTIGNVTVTFTRPVRSLRVEYAEGDEPGNNPAFQFIGISDFQFCAFDYGDAPSTYNTTIGGGTVARHTMGKRNLFMGTLPDGETDGTPSALADGDGADEDGVTFPTLISPVGAAQFWRCGSYDTAPGEFCVSVATVNTTGATAQLVGWVDFNADGDFSDANERSIPALGNGTGGAIDNTFTTGNTQPGVGTRILRWTGVTNATSAETYLRLRLTSDASFFSDASPQPNGQVGFGEIEDHRIPASTLPVRLMHVESQALNGKLSIKFSSATETNNVGYSIEEKRGNDYARVSSERTLLLSKSVNTADVSEYEITLDQLPASGLFHIADHDTEGRATIRGPFAVGQTYGVRPELKRVDWQGVRQSVLTQQSLARAAGVVNQGAKLWVSTPGFYRVTAAELLAQGVDLSGAPIDQIAVTFRGEAVPRRVHSVSGNFGSASYIDFLVKPGYSLYTKDLPYLVKADGAGVIKIDSDSGQPDVLRSAWYWSTLIYSPDTFYNFASPTEDPWHAGRMVAFPTAPASLSFNLTLNHMATTEVAPKIAAELIGVTNWYGAGQDHHVRLRFNGSEVGQTVFDGLHVNTLSGLLSNVANGTATIQVETTGQNGFDYDVVYLEKVELRYPRLPVAEQGRLFVQDINADTSGGAVIEADSDSNEILRTGFEGSNLRAGFVANGLLAGEVVAYAGGGSQWRHLNAVASQSVASGFDARVPFVSDASDYWVSNVSALHSARVEPLPVDVDITSGSADYLIISQSLFADQLGAIVALQQSRGLTSRIIDVAQIYQQFGDSLPEGQAIQRYLQQVAVPMGVDYVLLVGADTYDYKNFLGTGSVSFVPTLYSKVGDINYTPTDGAFADINGDDVPDFAIGRLPVRSLSELAAIRSKLVAVQGSNPQRSVLMVAGGSDGESNFSAISDGFAERLPGNWQSASAYVDTIGVAQANSTVLGRLNSGLSLLSYVGHSAPIQWSTADQTVLTSAQVFGLSNGITDLVIQWGCWNSYFVSPNADTMAHAFLLSPGKGAAGVIGVSSLTGAEAHAALGNALYPFLAPGARVGDALRSAKTALAGQSGLYRDILISSTLLGDPAMPIR